MKLAAAAVATLAGTLAPAAILPAGAVPLSGQQPETGTFTLTQNGTEIGREAFERSAEVLATELTIPGQATLVARGELRDDATIARLDTRVYGPGGATGEPVQTSAVVFEDGTVSFEQPIGTSAGEPGPVPAGAVPYLNPSPSLMEQIVRRARVVGGDSVSVPVWTPAPGGGQVISAAVAFAGDEAALTLGGVTIEVTTDAVGRLLSARVPTQALVIERR